jgi:hypothetical protein
MQAKHKNTGRWEGAKPCLSDFQVYLTAKKCGPDMPDPAVVETETEEAHVGEGGGGLSSR